MQIAVQFHSYFKDMTGCERTHEDLPAGATLGDLLERIFARFPKLSAMKKSMLLAVGVDYQKSDYLLKDGDEVSLFPPVQGG
jgi:MoaD family protein